MQNTFTIDADIKKTSYFNQPTVTQNDDITFIINITDDGLAFDLTNITTVSLANTRLDKEVVVTPGTISGLNQVTFNLGTNETAVSSSVNAVVQLYDANGRVSTLSFSYAVKVDPTGAGYVPSTSEQTLIEVVLNDGPLRIQEAIDAGVYATAQGVYAKSSGDTAITDWLTPVANFTAIGTTYTTPILGDTVQALDNGFVYRFDGTVWVYTQGYSATAIADVNAQLAQNTQETKNIKEEFYPIHLPTWDGASDALHPSVLYSPTTPIGGYKFWMVNTPLTAGNGYGDRWESPCVFRSVDGILWRVNSPAGNPLDDLTAEEIVNEGYFSDPCILRVGDNLEVWYRITTDGANPQTTTKVLRKVSTDGGFAWGAREVVYDSNINNGEVGTGQSTRSEQILYENGKYIMYYQTDTGIQRMETLNPTGSVWTNKTNITHNAPYIWHFTLKRHSGGKLHIVGYCSGIEKVVYLIGNTDFDFSLQKTIVSLNENISVSASRFYQSALCFVENETYVYVTMNSKRTGRWRTVLLRGASYDDLVPVKGELIESREVHYENIVLGNNLKANGKKDLMYRVYESEDGLDYGAYGYDLDTQSPIFHYKTQNFPIPIIIQDSTTDNATLNPITAPNYTGQLFQFLQTKKIYASFGKTAKEDWIEVVTFPKIAIRTVTTNPIALGAIPHYSGQLAKTTDTGEVYLGIGTASQNDWMLLSSKATKQSLAFTDGLNITNSHYKIVFNTSGTLTSLTGGIEGQEIIIVNGATTDITINSNATLILRGKVNRILMQYEAIKFTKTSTMWMEI